MPQIHRRVLDNGLTVLAEPMPAASSVALSLLVPAGVATQPDDAQGVAPLLAEYITRGAGGRGAREHSEALDALGVQRGADAQTRYFDVSAVLLGAQLDAALPLVLDMAIAPNLDNASFAACRDLAIQAIESLQDEPQQRAMIELRGRHLPPPLGRSPVGVRGHVEALTADTARSFWAERFRPGGAVLSFAGDVDVDRVCDRVAELTCGWSGTASPPVPVAPPPRRYHHIHEQSTQLHIALGHDAVPETDGRAVLQKAAVAVLSGGMSGRLFTEVREKRGLCYSVYASYVGQRDRGDVYAYAGTTTPRAQETLDVLTAELRKLAEGITPAEFGRAIVGMKSRLVMQGESTGARADAIATDFVTLGRARTLEERAAAVDAVTLDALRAFVAEHRPGQMSIVTLGEQPLNPPD